MCTLQPVKCQWLIERHGLPRVNISWLKLLNTSAVFSVNFQDIPYFQAFNRPSVLKQILGRPVFCVLIIQPILEHVLYRSGAHSVALLKGVIM